MVYIISARKASDRSFNDYGEALMSTFEMSLNVIFTCIPFFKVFLESVGSGLLNSDLRVLAPVYGYRDSEGRSREQRRISQSHSHSTSRRSKSFGLQSWTTRGESELGTRPQSSANSSQRNIITQTISWSLQSQNQVGNEERTEIWEMDDTIQIPPPRTQGC